VAALAGFAAAEVRVGNLRKEISFAIRCGGRIGRPLSVGYRAIGGNLAMFARLFRVGLLGLGSMHSTIDFFLLLTAQYRDRAT
jgi:hypothetical protein